MKYACMLLLVAWSSFVFSQTENKTALIKYKSANYSISYPDNWTIDNSKQMGTELIIFSPLEDESDKFRENINVIIQDLKGQPVGLLEFAKISEGQIRDMATDGKILASKQIETGGKEHYRMLYEMTQGNFRLTIEQYYFIQEGKAYVVTFTTESAKYDVFRQEGERVLDSFALK